MAELPSGTVTLLFSDMESSTQMVHALGEAWPGVLDRQRRLCRKAWSRHGGVELGTEGDSFFVAFPTPADAVAAALRAQRSLMTAPWPEGAVVRIRVGIHTGTPLRHGDGYVGMDVHRAARIAAAAHGGQVLVSEATLRVVGDQLPATVTARDLGEHQLKDIPTLMRLFQVDAEGLPSKFPPVRTLGGAGSLPTPVARGGRDIVGRDDEVIEVSELLAQGVRLVTLTGPGGTGKSTLAVAVAAASATRYPDAVFVAPMVGVSSAAGMWGSVSQVLDVPADGQVPPEFFKYVAHRRVLLVLDNLEQIEDADQMVRELLASAGHVAVVATSRRPLHVAGEHEYAVAPLGPQAAQELFAQHAVRVRRNFSITRENAADVAAICAALDGLPLAIELTAARCKLLSPKAILARIDQSLDLATGDRSRDPRQATIRGAIAWSYDLLDPAHRGVLDHLGVFVGGASFEAIAAVVPAEVVDVVDLADVLFALVDASLVTVTDAEDGEPRFALLETVRRFAVDRLKATGQHDAAVSAHAQYFYDYAMVLYELSDRNFAKGRAGLLGELGNISAMVERQAPGVVHRKAYPGPVPWLHVVALVAKVAGRCRQYPDSEAWCRWALDCGHADDRLGQLAVKTTLAFNVKHRGEVGAALRLCDEVWADLAKTEEAPEPLPPWVQPVRLVASVALLAGEMNAYRAELAKAATWRDRLAAVHDQLAADAKRFLPELDYIVAHAEGDLVSAREHLLEVGRRVREAGITAGVERNNLADLDLQLGDLRSCQWRLSNAADAIVADGDPEEIVVSSETMAAAIGPRHPLLCARVYGCTSVTRVVEGLGNDESGVAEDERVLAGVRPLADPAEWEEAWKRGQSESILDLFREMAALPIPAEDQGPRD